MRRRQPPRDDLLSRRRAIVVAAASLLLPTALVLSLIARTGDVSILNYFGSQGPSTEFIRENYPDAQLPDPVGHDGSGFYVISRTFPDLDRAAANLDNPAYRLRRILVPLVLHPFAGRAYTVALLLLTLSAIAGGAISLSILLLRAGFPWWMGASFGVSPGVLYATRFGLTDVIALALALAGLVVIERRRLLGAVAITAAALTRETALLAAAAVFVTIPKTRRHLLIPLVIGGSWILWVNQAFPKSDQPLVAPPFTDWSSHGAAPVVFAALLFLGSVAGAWTILRRAPALALLLLGEAAVLTVMASPVFFGGNFVRVVPLSVTGMLIAVWARLESRSQWGQPP